MHESPEQFLLQSKVFELLFPMVQIQSYITYPTCPC